MSRRKPIKRVKSNIVFVSVPKLIEGDDYSIAVIILFVLTLSLFFIFPQYILAGLAFDFCLLAIWQLYSGVALNITSWGRKVIAAYSRESQPALFYQNVAICFVLAVIMLCSFLYVINR